MEDLGRVKRFLKEHRAELLVVGLSTFAILGALTFVYYKGAKDGVKLGIAVGFQETINWFDKEFPGANLRILWENWALANPAKVITVN